MQTLLMKYRLLGKFSLLNMYNLSNYYCHRLLNYTFTKLEYSFFVSLLSIFALFIIIVISTSMFNLLRVNFKKCILCTKHDRSHFVTFVISKIQQCFIFFFIFLQEREAKGQKERGSTYGGILTWLFFILTKYTYLLGITMIWK